MLLRRASPSRQCPRPISPQGQGFGDIHEEKRRIDAKSPGPQSDDVASVRRPDGYSAPKKLSTHQRRLLQLQQVSSRRHASPVSIECKFLEFGVEVRSASCGDPLSKSVELVELCQPGHTMASLPCQQVFELPRALLQSPVAHGGLLQYVVIMRKGCFWVVGLQCQPTSDAFHVRFRRHARSSPGQWRKQPHQAQPHQAKSINPKQPSQKLHLAPCKPRELTKIRLQLECHARRAGANQVFVVLAALLPPGVVWLGTVGAVAVPSTVG